MGVGEVEPIKTKISGKFELVSRNFKNLSRNFEKMILVTKKRGEEKSPPPPEKRIKYSKKRQEKWNGCRGVGAHNNSKFRVSKSKFGKTR